MRTQNGTYHAKLPEIGLPAILPGYPRVLGIGWIHNSFPFPGELFLNEDGRRGQCHHYLQRNWTVNIDVTCFTIFATQP